MPLMTTAGSGLKWQRLTVLKSKYHVAELLWLAGDVKGAEKEVNEFIDMGSPHAYWTGKIFLLLSDISVKNGDTFQAKATLQSLIDYYTVKNDGIIDEARKRLTALNAETTCSCAQHSNTELISETTTKR